MTTYWVSNARHYCNECGCWMDAKPSSIAKHESGFRHKGNVDRLLKKVKREKIIAAKEANKHSQELAAIERAAKKQYIKDCTLDFSKKKRKDSKRSFIRSDNDIYYYMDKAGNTHGPYSSLQMSKWYHFGFFVGALRIRRRQQTDFIHLRDLQNPFNYAQFKEKFDNFAQFRSSVINSIDISDASTVPPGIDIPQKLKNEFYKLYPKQTKNNSDKNSQIPRQNLYEQRHKYYSDGKHVTMYRPHTIASVASETTNNNIGMSKKQQRTLFVRGKMRKYKFKCNCGDSDCHLKHNNSNGLSEEANEEMKKENSPQIIETKKETVSNIEKDEFGFGKWEQITKEEFDHKHSNAHLFKEREKNNRNKKRWWRDQINANLPVTKRKKLMGIDDMDSDNERDFDNEYGMSEILRQKNESINNGFHKQYKESKDKISISIGSKVNVKVKVNGNDTALNEDDIIVRDAKLKLKKLRENENKIEKEKKECMIESLNECTAQQTKDKNQNKREAIDKNMLSGLFKKKKKRKNRHNAKVVMTMR